MSFVDKVRKNGFVGRLTVFDRQVGGPMERPPLSKGFYWVEVRPLSQSLF